MQEGSGVFPFQSYGARTFLPFVFFGNISLQLLWGESMETYRNYGGNSDVARFEIAAGAIIIEFMSGTHRHYLFDEVRPGPGHVQRLQVLAITGRGLNSYIAEHLSSTTSYSSRW